MNRVVGARYLAILALMVVLYLGAWALGPVWSEKPPDLTTEFPQDAMELSPECQEMWMSEPDKEAFARALKGRNVRQYLEWGGGGSTFCAAGLVDQVTTIEHDEEWCLSLKEKVAQLGLENVHVICSIVPWLHTGDTEYGDGSYDQFRDYVDMIDNLDIRRFDVEPVRQLYNEIPVSFQLDDLAMLKKKPT